MYKTVLNCYLFPILTLNKAIFYLYIITATRKVILSMLIRKNSFNATPSKHTIESLVTHAELALQAFRLFFPRRETMYTVVTLNS